MPAQKGRGGAAHAGGVWGVSPQPLNSLLGWGRSSARAMRSKGGNGILGSFSWEFHTAVAGHHPEMKMDPICVPSIQPRHHRAHRQGSTEADGGMGGVPPIPFSSRGGGGAAQSDAQQTRRAPGAHHSQTSLGDSRGVATTLNAPRLDHNGSYETRSVAGRRVLREPQHERV
jgi:hypothetical protein